MDRTIENVEAAFRAASIGPVDSDRALICGFVRALGLQAEPSSNYLLCLYHMAAAVVSIREIQEGKKIVSPDIKRRLDLLLK